MRFFLVSTKDLYMRLMDLLNAGSARLIFYRQFFFLLLILDPFLAEGLQPSERLVPRLKGYLNSPYGFWEYLPKNYHETTQLPVVIYLHGIKEIGDGQSDLSKVLLNGVPYVIRKYQRDFPFILIAPQSPDVAEGFAPKRLLDLIKVVKSNYRIDEDRIYVTGISYGAYAALRLAEYMPDILAAVVPISSCGSVSDLSKLKNVPLWAFANTLDKKEIPECIKELVEGIRDQGGTPLLTLYFYRGHNAWARTYKNNFMWDWLLKQHRSRGNENQPPILIHPGNKTVGIGAAARFILMASDKNNDSLKFSLEVPLTRGSHFRIRKNGYAELTVNTLRSGIFNIIINVQDGRGGVSHQIFYLRTSYTLLFLPYILLFTLQPFIPALPFISLFLLLTLIERLATCFFNLITQLFHWLFITILIALGTSAHAL
jgi:hypothetical protein